MTFRDLIIVASLLTACSEEQKTDVVRDASDGGTVANALCTDGDSRSCGTDEGACVAGTEACTDGAWGACFGSIRR